MTFTRPWLIGTALASASLALVAGCSAGGDPSLDGSGRTDGAAHGDSSTGMDVARDGSTDGAVIADADATAADANCGSTSFAVHPIPPNVLVLLDRSCSMRRTPDGTLIAAAGTGTTKWEIASAALTDLTTAYASLVHWGLIYLPRSGTVADGAACGATPVCGGTTSCPEVAPGPGNGPAVVAQLGMISPYDGCDNGMQNHITPLNDALIAARGVTELHDTSRPDIVLLITDGQESCLTNVSATDAVTLASQVGTLLAMNIKTAVVGFGATGGTDGVDPVELNAMAAAGGLPASGATQYYSAMDSASLHTAFDTIIASTLSCTFALTGAVTDPALLHVFVNGSTTELPRDTGHASGWDYDATAHSVTVYGSTCDDVHHGRLQQFDVLQSCPGGPPPPPPGMCHVMGQSCTNDTDCCGVRGFACDPGTHTCLVAPG